MSRLKIAVACQGGGSQTAFTAGALKALCEARIGEEFDVVGISGTSGGAVCATLLWYSFMKGERPIDCGLYRSPCSLGTATGRGSGMASPARLIGSGT